MKPTQDPKYGINDEGQICNITTGTPIPDGEPIFIFRAQDALAVQPILYYSTLVVTEQHKMAIKARISHFNRFSLDYPERMKAPDTVYPYPRVSESKE